MEEEDLVAIFTGSPRDAQMLKSVLAGSGIESMTAGSGLAGAYPVDFGDLAKTKLLVRAHDAGDARAIIAGDEVELTDLPDNGAASSGTPMAAPGARRVLVGRTLVGVAVAVLILTVAAWLAGELRHLVP